jgi:hypothetical protein
MQGKTKFVIKITFRKPRKKLDIFLNIFFDPFPSSAAHRPLPRILLKTPEP